MLDFPQYLKLFIGLLAIVNPLGAIPIFISMTAGDTKQRRRKTINLVVLAITVILLIVLFFGELLLQFFGITIHSFRVGGGILILLMALGMLNAKPGQTMYSGTEGENAATKDSMAIVPIAMPLLAGPGAISTIILAAHRGNEVGHYFTIAFGILVLSLIIWALLRMSPWIESRISASGINIFTRIMGLILAAIAVEFIANGLKGLFPVLV